MKDEASYVCDSCGEEIVLPIDLSAGSEQEYVEDCAVCCRPNVIHVEVDEDGDVRMWAAKQDRQGSESGGHGIRKVPRNQSCLPACLLGG